MRLSLTLAFLVAAASPAAGFAPSSKMAPWGSSLQSTVEAISGAEIKSRMDAQMEKLKAKDQGATAISAQDLKVVFEDEHIVVVDKPAGVLCVPSAGGASSLSEAVFEKYGSESGRADKMVVHRLGMDTSGLVVFARTDLALRQMNLLFRTRKVTREYEALLCGSVGESGEIDLPLMRDYEFPPFMRVSSDDHQRALIGLDADEVGRKLLEHPKDSVTKYAVVGQEEFAGQPVTRVSLTSVTGRFHQLNVHCAAMGNPIVGDTVYGINGAAAANGGLDEPTSASKASAEAQEAIATGSAGKSPCVHAKSLAFEHPASRDDLSFESAAPF